MEKDKWCYNKESDWWELPPKKAFIGGGFTAVKRNNGIWELNQGCKDEKVIGNFKYLKNAKKAGYLKQELDFLISNK